ncbi:MAG: Ldh family oxidoreductase [Candidatus Omnitrophica bacterium]|nr:Ldh family oxidoreductase [Candidatus Omnitrophota bacterium]
MKSKAIEEIKVSAKSLHDFMMNIMLKAGVRRDVAFYVTDGLVQTSLRGVDSHGLRLFPHYLKGVKGGRINPDPKYVFKRTSASTGKLDADHTFGHAAGMEAVRKAIELAKEAGTGHVAVYNSSHFGAAAYYALEIAKHDMIGFSFTNTDALIKPHGGKEPFLGNNPIAFTVPCEDEEPLCLDMATSVVTFNKIRQLRDSGLEAPPGVGADRNGVETTDPHKITTLLPIGGYKGYGLSLMIEVLCSLLTGMPYGPNIPKMFEAPMSQHRMLGHFMIAVRIDCFQPVSAFKKRMSLLMNDLRSSPAIDKHNPVMVSGDPEKKKRSEREKAGIPLTKIEYEALIALAEEYGVPFP